MADAVEVPENLPELPDEAFPPHCESEEDRLRFRLCHAIAVEQMGEDSGPNVWQFARSLYRNPNFTL